MALVTAIFLLVVLAALGTYMATISSVQHSTSAYGVQGSRAYQAARAGIEWGAYRVLNDGDCGAFPETIGEGDMGGTLSAFSVTVTCSGGGIEYDEKGDKFHIFTLTAEAESPAGGYGRPGYVRREIQATVTDATS
ncbi:MAG TPA: pilus assembly PilX N-terminal domain-containing protein [Gammaproteobacteria bacterium]|nr:pilus assembly PilX N-terminal domain-containing protein [Gammaproteobacteria bacterium]